MTVEEFIKKNPFPKDGTAINNQLVKDIQDPNQIKNKDKNLQLLLKNNARLIYMVYHQYNYNQELASIMSFVYEGISKATDTYDPKVGMPFYQYAVQTIRGLLQNWYNYNNTTIHIPVMKRKPTVEVDDKGNVTESEGMKFDYTDINDFTEHQECDQGYAVVYSEVDDATTELNEILTEFKLHHSTTDTAITELEMFELYRNNTLKEIAEKTGVNTVKVKKMIDNTTNRLERFVQKMENAEL